MKSLSIQKSWIILLIMIVVTSGMCSCSTMPFRSPEDALRIRVEEMMNARVDGDWGKVYGYLDSSYRKRVSKDAFLKHGGEMHINKYSITSIEIQPSKTEAVVKVSQDIRANVFDFKDVPQTQNWIKDGFTWYLKVND